MRNNRLGLISGAAALLLGSVVLAGCSDDGGDGGGKKQQGTGGSNEGGAGGSETGGSSSGGGSNTGGENNLGGGGMGGETGGTNTGGTGTGGENTGGTNTGGTGTGGENTGGTNTGGTGTGGENTGGTGTGGGTSGGDEFGPITLAESRLLTGVNDLKGLIYSSCQPGKLYASGYSNGTGGDREIALVRLNADGTFDDSFGTDGVVLYNAAPSGQTEESTAVVELPESCELLVLANVSDGRGGASITDIAGGAAQVRPHGTDAALIKFDELGDLVTGFGDGGIKIVDLGWTDSDVNAHWPVPTYDSSKPAAEQWSSPAGFPVDAGGDLVLDPSSDPQDPKVVLFAHGTSAYDAGAQSLRTDNDRYVVRLLASDGSVDDDFNGGEVFTFGTPGGDNGRRGYVQADGKIVQGGYTSMNTGHGALNHVLALRLNADGTPDSSFTFGNAPSAPIPGVFVANPFGADGGQAECYQALPQSSGRFVTTGYGRATTFNTATPSSLGFTISKANDMISVGFLPGATAALDTSYGSQGALAIQSEDITLTPGGFNEQSRDIVVLKDDRVVHAGHFASGGTPAQTFPGLFVTTPDGLADDLSGTEGRFRFNPDSVGLTTGGTQFYNVALSEDGTRVAATTAANDNGVLIAILDVTYVE